jgi:adenine-specific DNA-methyltransferase
MPVLERLDNGRSPARFLDPFSGSGSVSRLARAMGMRVEANDWEPYSQAINLCWLGLGQDDLGRAFGGTSVCKNVLEEWNAMHPLAAMSAVPDSALGDPYMARWYAPRHTEAPRLDEERLFYTAENAMFIDRVRTRIQKEYPDPEPGSDADVRRTVLLAALLLEAATHANTSGVFKAYHRGFGGNAKDALGRIMGRMELEHPILPEAAAASVSCMDAKTFLMGRPADIVYFDPPYNQHQYGSNYHILNTILRWDGKSLPIEGTDDGSCSRKAGIPETWKLTRSAFCSKPAVREAIREVLDAADAAMLVFSWNADGHLTGEELAEILSARGRLEIAALDYTAYRGGRQSASKSTGSREYLFLVDTRGSNRGKDASVREIRALAGLDAAVRAQYDPGRVAACFGLAPASAGLFDPLPAVPRGGLPADNSVARQFFRPDLRAAADCAALQLADMEADGRTVFLGRLASCACSDGVEQLSALQGIAERALACGDRPQALRALREAPRLIRKLAHRKYEGRFRQYVEVFRNLGIQTRDSIIIESLENLETLMVQRISRDRNPHSS